MKASIIQVLSQTSLLIVQFSNLKTSSWTFLMKNQLQTGAFVAFCDMSFKCSINQLLGYCSLTNVIAVRFLTNFTFVLQRISEWQFLMNFCYTELLFPGTLNLTECSFLLEQAVQSVQKNSFQKYSEKKFPGRQTQQSRI